MGRDIMRQYFSVLNMSHIVRVVDYPSVRYLDPQLGTGHPCTRTTRTSSVLYFLIRYLDPKVQ